MCECKEKEAEATCEKGEVARKISARARETAARFARDIMKVLGELKSKRDEYIEKFLGAKRDRTSTMTANFPFFQRAQAIYALNYFPVANKNCTVTKITNITDEGEEAPTYERVRIGRKKRVTLLTIGEILLKYKKEPMILELYFCGCTLRSKIYYKTKAVKKANEFQDEFTKYMRKNNFLKGEKLVFLAHSLIDFLEYPKLSWSDVVLKPEIRESIMLNVVFPITNEKKCTNTGIPWRRGLLMGGVAGTGKTQVCRILCNELPDDATLIWATPKALYESDKIQDLFEAARYFSPTVIVIEDIDFIGTSREFTQNPILGELLTQLDGNDPNHGIFIVATTNRPQQLDVALANRPSRFDVKLEFSLPSEKERIELMKLFTKEMVFEEKPDWNNMAVLSKNLTGAHIKEIFVYAQLKALKRGSKKVSREDILERIKQYKQADVDLKKYRS